ncbi:MAG TPA: hypothetical protein PLU24_05450, partial [Candidatus Omnitrophota bacterium]|nr:hypothetical protein [Candidatus Omnitrophota bacterium]
RRQPVIFFLMIILFTSFSNLSMVFAQEETRVVPSVGEYDKIRLNITDSQKAIIALKTGGPDAETTIKNIESAPGKFIPVVFYQLAFSLFEQGKKEEAMVWLLRGELRARFDANRCADSTARSAVSAMNSMISQEFRVYMSEHLGKLVEIAKNTVEWDKITPYDYDQRWINLHGTQAISAGLKGEQDKEILLSLPQEQWPDIAERTRRKFIDGFQEAQEIVSK